MNRPEDKPRWTPLEGERVDVVGEGGIRVAGTIDRAWYMPSGFTTPGHWQVKVRLDEQPLEVEAAGPEQAAPVASGPEQADG